MLQQQCDVCGQPAAIQETAVEGGTVLTRHFCPEHGEAVWRAAVPLPGDADSQAAALRDLEQHWHGLPEAEREQLAQLYRRTHRGT